MFCAPGARDLASSDFVWAENNGKGLFNVHENVSKGRGDFLQGVAIVSAEGNPSFQVALSWHKSGYGVQMLRVPEKPTKQT